MTSVQAGEVEAVHKLTTDNVWAQQGVAVEGQTDILTMGLPYISPYNVNSILNPILVACLGLGYFFNLYRGKPLVREGGVLIMTHPTPWEFNPVHHPSYIDFFEQVLTETTDPIEVADRFEESFATDPWYIHLYRTGHAYHGVHPFYMWYWCAHALQHLGAVIVVGRRRAPPSTGWASGRRPPWPMPWRWPRTWSARRRPSPICTPRPSSWPTCSDGPAGHVQLAAEQPGGADRRRARPTGAGPDGGGGGAPRSPGPAWLASRIGRARFPLAAPSWPESVPRPPPEPELGRRTTTPPGPAGTRSAWPGPWSSTTWPGRWPGSWPPRLIRGDEGLTGPSRPPVIFAANHASHVDTPLLLSCLPLRFRHRTVVAAAADYFFDRRWKADAWSFLLAAIPIERTKVNRRSAELAAELLDDEWNLVIFPEGGRSPDGWGQDFTGGAAYLAVRTGRPVVPVHLDGTRAHPAQGAEGPAPHPDHRHLRHARCGPTRTRTPAASVSGSRRPWPPWPHEVRTDWWTARKQAAPGRPRRCRAPMRRPGAVRGRSPRS